jgi:opacity protein-like surface antigen
MRTVMGTVALMAMALPVAAQDSPFSAGHWSVRFDLGGNMPSDPELTRFSGPITEGGEMDLTAGGHMGMAMGYRLTPWLTLEGELGLAFNNVDSVGNWSYRDSGLSHLLMMVNLVVERPYGNWVPFAGAGVGGDYSMLTFGSNYDWYWYYEPDAEGTDFVWAYQAFAGLKYRFNDNFTLGVMYRYFGTQDQKWDVEWWYGDDFEVGVKGLGVHSVSLVLSASF